MNHRFNIPEWRGDHRQADVIVPDARTALVTGACGFLGSRIAEQLAGNEYRVVGIDRGIGDAPAGIQCLAMSLPGDAFSEILATEQPSLIVHTAGPASVAASVADPLADFEGSVRVHAHVLEAVRLTVPDARFITLSSAAVYGNPSVLPIAEDAPLAPISPYGHHKAMCEALLREYSSIFGMKTCALRIFSAYGAGLKRQLLWDVCEKATAGSVRLFGTGDETRDFIHADDVARAVLTLAEGAAFEGEAYNAATGNETSVREVVTQLVGAFAPGVAVEFSGEQRAGDPLRWRADIARIRGLGFEPSRSLADGLAEYVAWYGSVNST